jgi:hypothetical protein
MSGRSSDTRNSAGTEPSHRPSYADLYHAVYVHSPLAYSETLTDEKKETAAGFWQRTREFFETHGITVLRVLTDKGSCHRSRAFAQVLGPDTKHKLSNPGQGGS